MKRMSIGLASILLASGIANAQSLNLNEGWNNVGVVDPFNVSSITDDSVELIWTFSNNSWRVYAPDTAVQEEIQTIIDGDENSTMETLSGTITAGSALWIRAASPTTLDVGVNTIRTNVSGVLRSAQNYSTIENADISVYSGTDTNDSSALIADAIEVGSNGDFYINNLSGGEYTLVIDSEGYMPYSTILNVDSSANIDLSQIHLIPEQNDINATVMLNVSGEVIDSASSDPLAGMMSIRTGHNNRTGLDPVVLDYNGTYDLNLTQGGYTFELQSQGYYTSYVNVNVYDENNETNITRNFSLNEELSEDSIARIRLDWGENPRDLDSHLLIKEGEFQEHVYYSDSTGRDDNYNEIANLDRDDTSSYGPETITILNTPNAMERKYSYYVYKYSGTSTLANSNARVTVNYQDQEYVFNVPSGDEERYWKVFEIIDGVLLPCASECLITETPGLARTIDVDEDIATIKEAVNSSYK